MSQDPSTGPQQQPGSEPGYPPAYQPPQPPAYGGPPVYDTPYSTEGQRPYEVPYPPPYVPGYQASELERNRARKQVQARRGLAGHAVSYVAVNLFLILVWAFTGAGYFWPIWVLAGWGVGLVLNAWDVLFRRPVTEEDIEREMRRNRGKR